jgi:hypothetical protein
MLRNRILVVAGACLLAGSAAMADEVGYVDCTSHSEGAQVFGKPRRTQDTVASLACGERFTILVYGFYFSRIQTSAGQVGYIYSSLIAVDRAATSVQPKTQAAGQQTAQQGQPAASLQVASEKTKIPRTLPIDAQPKASAAAPQPAVAAGNPADSSAAVAQSAPSVSSQATTTDAAPVQPAAPQPAPAAASATSAADAKPAVTDTATPAAQPVPSAPAQPEAVVSQPTAVATAAVETAAAGSTGTEAATTAEPAPAQPEAAQPAAPAIRPADTRETWEKPRPSLRGATLIELYGGYAFARIDGGGGAASNLNGALGAFGWNVKPWLQIVGDTSYSFQTVGTTKNIIYGNHYGVRYFHRRANRWGITPFVEGLVGGSRADTKISGVGGYTLSANCISYKVGGGLDIHPSRRWEIRLVDADYYRTSFGTNKEQNNYWISTGVVLRLFGGPAD